MKNSQQGEKGQSMVLIALLTVGLVAFAGLLVDGGRYFATRRTSQNAADAAAFAGARRLAVRTGVSATDDADIQALIYNFARANGVTNPTTDVEAYYMYPGSVGPRVGAGVVPIDVTGVRVYTTERLQPFLISVLFGGGPFSIRTVGTVQSGLMTSPDAFMPMTVQTQSFTYGQRVRLFGDNTGSGNFQWLDFDGPPCNTPSDPNLDSAILLRTPSPRKEADPDGTYISSVDTLHWICGGTGTKASQAPDLDWWLDKLEKDRHWIIPVYDVFTNSGSNLAYHIVSFAEFIVTGYDLGGIHRYGENCPPGRSDGKCIVGSFQKFTGVGSGDLTRRCNTNGTDGCTTWLTE